MSSPARRRSTKTRRASNRQYSNPTHGLGPLSMAVLGMSMQVDLQLGIHQKGTGGMRPQRAFIYHACKKHKLHLLLLLHYVKYREYR
jgi:hypothetical protein